MMMMIENKKFIEFVQKLTLFLIGYAKKLCTNSEIASEFLPKTRRKSDSADFVQWDFAKNSTQQYNNINK
jgi:hypothetical protein